MFCLNKTLSIVRASVTTCPAHTDVNRVNRAARAVALEGAVLTSHLLPCHPLAALKVEESSSEFNADAPKYQSTFLPSYLPT